MKLPIAVLAVLVIGVSASAENISVATIDVWSGLAENGVFRVREYEDRAARAFRYDLLSAGLAELSPDIIAVQDANPLPAYVDRLAADLGYDTAWLMRQAGVRVGPVGFPTNLREGSAVLAPRDRSLTDLASRQLRGGGAGKIAAFQLGPASNVHAVEVQVAERPVYVFNTRWTPSPHADGQLLKALVDRYVSGELEDSDFVDQVTDAVNGSDVRRREAERTLVFINEIAGQAPVILMGSFHALPASEEIALLREAGFVDVWEAVGRGDGTTYDPSGNSNITNHDRPASAGGQRIDGVAVRYSIHLRSTDPWTNIAAEQDLFENPASHDHGMVLWSNAPCVVIGRHQNPWTECDITALKTDSVPLVRRTSGGGAVYHDEGNLNFTFIGRAAAYDLDRQFDVVLRGLHSLGIDAERNDRNDLVIREPSGSRKISGSAFRHARGRSLHHGTLLVNTDLERPGSYLKPPEHGITGKGIRSVRSAVVNLSELRPGLTVNEVVVALQSAYSELFGPITPHLPPDEHGVAVRRGELSSWQWCYGRSPVFTRTIEVRLPPAGRTPVGGGTTETVRFDLVVRRGRIESIAAGDGPGRETAARLAGALTDLLAGERFAGDVVRNRAADAPESVSPAAESLAKAIP
jgi:lipoate-protein ligase A